MNKIFSWGAFFAVLWFMTWPVLAAPALLQYKVWEGKLNINDASSAELVMLEGVGKATAHRIVAYREKAGGFKSLAQMKEVKGLGEGSFSRIEGHITLFEKSDLRILVDVNSAPVSALNALPGVSKKMALSVAEYRERNEGFKVVEDLLKIDGMSMSKFKELRHFVTVRPMKIAVKEMP